MKGLNRPGGIFPLAAFCLCGLLVAGCAKVGAPILDKKPVVAGVTKPNFSLRNLPPPRSRTVVAVYDFEDLTGQFKERENVQTLSRAVTQGGAAILIKALQDAGERRWFTVLERKDLDNLLRERQILTEMRRIYRNEQTVDPDALPPLRHASIIFEGGIVGYDTNMQTGGAGARFLGIGGDGRWVKDVATVTLRIVSTKTGEVLTAVTVRKSVASYALQGGAFRFIRLDELLEIEAGVTYNEPRQIAVQSAIEKAVESIIIEGAELGVWKFEDEYFGADLIAAYRGEKYGKRINHQAFYPQGPDTRNADRISATHPDPDAFESAAVGPAIQPQAVRRAPQAIVPRPDGGVRVLPGYGVVPENGGGGGAGVPIGPDSPAQAAPAAPDAPAQAPRAAPVRPQPAPRQLPPAPAPDEGPVGQLQESTDKVAEARPLGWRRWFSGKDRMEHDFETAAPPR